MGAVSASGLPSFGGRGAHSRLCSPAEGLAEGQLRDGHCQGGREGSTSPARRPPGPAPTSPDAGGAGAPPWRFPLKPSLALTQGEGPEPAARGEPNSASGDLSRGGPGAGTCCSCLMLLLLPIFSRWALKAWMLAAPSEKRRTGEKRSVGRCSVFESL